MIAVPEKWRSVFFVINPVWVQEGVWSNGSSFVQQCFCEVCLSKKFCQANHRLCGIQSLQFLHLLQQSHPRMPWIDLWWVAFASDSWRGVFHFVGQFSLQILIEARLNSKYRNIPQTEGEHGIIAQLFNLSTRTSAKLVQSTVSSTKKSLVVPFASLIGGR